jgi:hypothetical protein
MAAGVSGTSVTPARKERSWFSLTLSAALHIVILVLAVRLSRMPAPEPEPKKDQTAQEQRAVQMVYLPKPPPPAAPKRQPPPPPPPPPTPRTQPPPPPIPRPFSPPPKKEQKTPEPDANAPPEAERSKGSAEPDDKPKQPERAGQPDVAAPTSELATKEALMESEAKRIFGSPKKYTPEGVGPRASRPMEAYLPDHPERCTPRQPSPDSMGPQYGTVMGKIYRQDNGRPLSGAHLQMLGTPYVTFTDGTGAYRFRFDLSLVDNCRTQYVRVTAAGYESRLLVLVVGPNAVSEDVTLRRK